jgi:hypothetical protein
MTDFEKAYRKMELKEQSGMNSDKEMAEALSALVCGPDGRFEYEPEKYEKEAREGFLKVFGIIPKADYEENISLCLETLNELKEQLNNYLTTMEMIPAVKACVELEPKLAAVCYLLFWEISRGRKSVFEENTGEINYADPGIQLADICGRVETWDDAEKYYRLVVINLTSICEDIKLGAKKQEYKDGTSWTLMHISSMSRLMETWGI